MLHCAAVSRSAAHFTKATSVCPITDQGYAAAGCVAKGHNLKFASIQLYHGGLSVRALELRAARTGFA
jgi:hypothetical protein